MNERKIQKSLKQFMVNPFWKEYYERMPCTILVSVYKKSMGLSVQYKSTNTK